MDRQSSRLRTSQAITVLALVVALLMGAAPLARAVKAPTATSAGSATIGAGANVWGSFDVTEPIEAWTEALLPSGKWSRSQTRTTTDTGGYVIPLTYGANSPGDQQFRVGGAMPDGTVAYSEPFTFTRIGGVSAAHAGSAPVGRISNVWGTVRGGAHVEVWTEVLRSSGWSTSQKGTTNGSGGYVLPLTFGQNSSGVYTYRVAARYPGGAIVRSDEFRFTRGNGTSGDVDCTKVACVAITFDDGPGDHTARLLDILKARNAKATFFTVGWRVNTNPSLVRRAHAEGHEIGNHSYNHPDLTKQRRATIRSELARTSDAILRATGERPTAMRPPYGAWNETVRSVVKERNEGPTILWDVDTLDWQHRNPRTTIQKVKTLAKPGSIILMHDIHKTTVDAVPGVIDALRAKGYHLVTVEQLLSSDSVTGYSIRSHGPR